MNNQPIGDISNFDWLLDALFCVTNRNKLKLMTHLVQTDCQLWVIILYFNTFAITFSALK